MSRKPTGKSPGRPKGEPYGTLLARVPQAFIDRVQHYARIHGQSISALIRDGLEWRITEADPRANIVYYGNTPPEVEETESYPVEEEVSCNTEIEPVAGNGAKPVPPFDTTKYRLGKLCPRKHEYGTTKQTLRRLPKSICLRCDAEDAKERRANRRVKATDGE